MKPVRGFLFACTNRSEDECLSRMLFATEKIYGPIVIRIRKGDLLFLNNLDTDTIFGVFRSTGKGQLNINKEAFGGRYPYQVKVESIGGILSATRAGNLLKKYGIRRNIPILGKKLVKFLEEFKSYPVQLSLASKTREDINKLIVKQIEKIKRSIDEVDIEEEIPLIETTTFWDFPKQSYGLSKKGDNKYAGVTPALIIYNMVWRYTGPGDLVVDPMCGSGTTIDVCKEEKRRVKGFDIHSTRPDIKKNDARKMPIKSETVDMVFIDSPYGDNIKYNDEPGSIGNISSESDEFYNELEKVIQECHRIMKDGKVLGWLIGDQWVRNKFTPVGFGIYEKLCKYFEPVDLICVARRSQSSNTGMWHNRARRHNFYLRGFKYLIIVKKVNNRSKEQKPRKIDWAYYERNRGRK